MAIYRSVQMSFWTDSKVVDNFTPEDRYFYLYLLTNPHTNLCGCYELSLRQVSNETGYKEDVIKRLIKRMQEEHKVIVYDSETKEILLINWNRFNWTNSEKFRKPLWKEIERVKKPEFKSYLSDLFKGIDTVSIPYPYGSDTSVTVTVTDTVTVSDTDTDTVTVINQKKKKESYGDHGLVKLTIDEHDKLVRDYGAETAKEAIDFLDSYIADKGYKSKSNYDAIKRWVINAVRERKGKQEQKTRSESIDDFFKERISGG